MIAHRSCVASAVTSAADRLSFTRPDQPIGVGGQRRPLRPRRELPDQGPRLHHELDLLVVLALIGDRAVHDRPGVIDPHVVEHVQEICARSAGVAGSSLGAAGC